MDDKTAKKRSKKADKIETAQEAIPETKQENPPIETEVQVTPTQPMNEVSEPDNTDSGKYDKMKQELDAVLNGGAKNKSNIPKEEFNPTVEPVVKNTPDAVVDEAVPEAPPQPSRNIASPQFGEIPIADDPKPTYDDSDLIPPAREEGEPMTDEEAEKTADIFLTGAEKFISMPFLAITKIGKKKTKQLHKSGEIDLDMLLQEPDHTVRKDIENYNKACEANLILTEKDKATIKPPLMDVLKENNVKLSAGWRLVMAVGVVMVGKIEIASQLWVIKQEQMEGYKTIQANKYEHELEMERVKQQGVQKEKQEDETVLSNETTEPPQTNKKKKKVATVNDYLIEEATEVK